MELSAYYLRTLGFRRKRKQQITEYKIDIAFSYGNWVTIVIARVQGGWVIRQVKSTGKYGKRIVSEHIIRSTVDEVIALAEIARTDQLPEGNWQGVTAA